MKRILLIVFLLPFSGALLAQEKSFDIALNMGVYATPKFEKAQSGRNYSADFDYHFKKGWILSSGFNFGHFRYFESKLSNEPNAYLYSDGTNAEASDRQVSVKLKKDLFKESDFNIRVGTGFTIFTETTRYPFRYSNSSYSFAQSTFTDLAFPVSIESYLRIYSRFSLGLKGEMYLLPGFPVLGFNMGPQLRVKL